MNFNRPFDAEGTAESDRAAEQPAHEEKKRGRRGRLIVLGVAVVLAGALTAGAWNHLTQYRLSADAEEQELDFVPQVRVASVEPSSEIDVVNLPATTSAFATANIFARASGYIGTREVDIGDRVADAVDHSGDADRLETLSPDRRAELKRLADACMGR